MSLETHIQDIDPIQESVVDILKQEFPDIEDDLLDIYQIIELNNPRYLYPPIPCEEKIPIDRYTAIHSEIHQAMVYEILEQDWEVLVLESGMFGGKTSLSYKIADELENRGYTVGLSIADAMGEDYITARSYQDGKKVRPATRYGEKFPDIVLPNAENGKNVVILDEFSFLETKYIKKFVDECRENNVKVILTGLNRNHLGKTLKVFEDLESITGKDTLRIRCDSFVPGIDEDEPTGTHTVRYLKINGREILDLGVLPEIVSKEEENKSGEKLVRYASAKKSMTCMSILKGTPLALRYILEPTDQQKDMREKRKKILEKK